MTNVIPFPKPPPTTHTQAQSPADEKTCANGWHIPSRANPRVCRDCCAWPLSP